ncbi:MAG: choice-of-anchor J domain-containing protein, partial [Prevotella sp.]|nr:choice-of-anchor J domain-containing protein [Prevotella sp.]
KGKHLSFFARSKNKEYHDNFGVFFLPDGKEKEPDNLMELGVYTDIPHEWTEYNIDLSTLGEGQVVFRHFNSGDKWALYIDDVTIFDQNAVYHPEQYNWVTMPHVSDNPHLIFGLESDTKYEMQMQVEPAGWGESVFFTTTKQPISTGVENGQRESVYGQRDEWYSVDGQKLSGKPTKKGVYIHNGKAVLN